MKGGGWVDGGWGGSWERKGEVIEGYVFCFEEIGEGIGVGGGEVDGGGGE